MATLFSLVYLLFILGIFAFTIYVVITILNLMKQRNEYLKDIRDELRKGQEDRKEH